MDLVKVKLTRPGFPKILADLSQSNQVLKMTAALSLSVSLGLLVLSIILIKKGPVVIALSPEANVMKDAPIPDPEVEIRAALRAYIERRYNWNKNSIDRNLELARAFISPQYVQHFVQGVSNVRKFSKDKEVAQRVYPANFSVDLKKGIVLVTGDRISEIQGIRAVGPLNLELSLQTGSRSRENPWGIYISKETEK